MQIAAEHSETVGQGSGVGMKKGLLFDRVTLHSGDITPRNVEPAAVVKADFADSGLPLGNGAAVAAGITTHSIAIQLFPKSGVSFPNTRLSGQNVAQCGHKYILRLRAWVCQGMAGRERSVEILI